MYESSFGTYLDLTRTSRDFIYQQQELERLRLQQEIAELPGTGLAFLISECIDDSQPPYIQELARLAVAELARRVQIINEAEIHKS
jgi:hypothetical protein